MSSTLDRMITAVENNPASVALPVAAGVACGACGCCLSSFLPTWLSCCIPNWLNCCLGGALLGKVGKDIYDLATTSSNSALNAELAKKTPDELDILADQIHNFATHKRTTAAQQAALNRVGTAIASTQAGRAGRGFTATHVSNTGNAFRNSMQHRYDNNNNNTNTHASQQQLPFTQGHEHKQSHHRTYSGDTTSSSFQYPPTTATTTTTTSY